MYIKYPVLKYAVFSSFLKLDTKLKLCVLVHVVKRLKLTIFLQPFVHLLLCHPLILCSDYCHASENYIDQEK